LLQINPQSSRGQAGRRPARVLSPREYDRRAGLAPCCPITSEVTGYSRVVPLPPGFEVQGAVLADQVKSLHWRGRKASRLGVSPPSKGRWRRSWSS
jgi:mRNA interferase MazF